MQPKSANFSLMHATLQKKFFVDKLHLYHSLPGTKHFQITLNIFCTHSNYTKRVFYIVFSNPILKLTVLAQKTTDVINSQLADIIFL